MQQSGRASSDKRALSIESNGLSVRCCSVFSSVDDDSDDGCDWLVWTLRVLFLCALIALAVWGKILLDAEAASAAAEASNPPAVPSDVGTSSDDSVCKEGHDADLVYVCWWMVLIEASVAAVSGGVILAQSIASACDW